MSPCGYIDEHAFEPGAPTARQRRRAGVAGESRPTLVPGLDPPRRGGRIGSPGSGSMSDSPGQKALPRFHGRPVSAGPPILPLLLLTTTGRVSGHPRGAPLVYLPAGVDVVVVGSNWGQPHHPQWSGRPARCPGSCRDQWPAARSTCQTGDRHRASAPAARLLALYPPYQAYADRSARNLRLFILSPA